MCFLAVLMLKKMIDEKTFARIMTDLGFDVEIRNGVVEARRGFDRVRALIRGDEVEVEAEDYGPRCLKDYESLIRSLIEVDADPQVIYFRSPYIYGFEKKRGRVRKTLEEAGIEVEEVYSGRCG